MRRRQVLPQSQRVAASLARRPDPAQPGPRRTPRHAPSGGAAAQIADSARPGSTDEEVILTRARRPLTVALLAATAAGLGATPATPAATDRDPSSARAGRAQALSTANDRLSKTNDHLRRQLARERARTVRLLSTERAARARVVAAVRRQERRAHVAHALEVASATYGVPESRLRAVAHCESRFVPTAQNGPYLGLFQFGTTLWSQTPYRGFSRSDPYAASLAASWAFARGMSARWPVCGR